MRDGAWTWYEAEDTATVVVYSQALSQESFLNVTTNGKSLAVTAGEESIKVDIDHKYEIEQVKCFLGRAEVLLRKHAPGRWRRLTGGPRLDQIFERAKEIDLGQEEEIYSNDAVMNLFQKIYNSSSDEVKKEMNRSFFESGGTELRTAKKDGERRS